MDQPRIPPQNSEAEESVLGGILLSNEKAAEVRTLLAAEDFYREKHRRVFACQMALDDRREPIDLITLASELKSRQELDVVGGEAFLAYLAGRVPTAANILHYAQAVKDKSVLRQVIGLCQESSDLAFDEEAQPNRVLDRLDQRALEVRGHQAQQKLFTAAEAVRSTSKQLERIMDLRDGDGGFGLSPGLVSIECVIGRLYPKDQIIIAARPSDGKTSMAVNNIALSVSRHAPVVIVSGETAKEKLIFRAIASLGREIDMNNVRAGEHMEEYADISGDVAARNFHVVEGVQPLSTIRAFCRQVARRNLGKQGVVILDYIQLWGRGMRADQERVAVSSAAWAMKQLAEELGWTSILLSQLNREGIKDDTLPEMHHLKATGDLEQDADVVAFIHSSAEARRNRRGLYHFYTRKQRDALPLSTDLHFEGRKVRFFDTASDEPRGPEQGALI